MDGPQDLQVSRLTHGTCPGRYSYRIVLGKLRPGGHLTATVASNSLHLRASLLPSDGLDRPCSLAVDALELVDLGKIEVHATGLGDFNQHLSKFLTQVTAELHTKISEAVGQGIKDAIVKAGLDLNCSSLLRL